MSSAVAGKVLMIPKGDYNASATYDVLDWVLYNGRPYVAKQTTTGNLPTNTTYWQLLLDFPTEVDSAPTENSQHLVTSGGVYTAISGKQDANKSYSTDNGTESLADADYVPFYDSSASAPKKTLWSSIVSAVTAVFTGATSQANGVKGTVPAPLIADRDKFLKGDGTWGTPPAPSDMTGATASVAGTHGLVPAPTTSDTGNFLKGDGTWGAVDLTSKMDIDGSNATNVLVGTGTSSLSMTMTKDSGANQSVTFTKTLSYDYEAIYYEYFLKSHISDSKTEYNTSGTYFGVVIDSVTRSDLTVTATAHLVQDTAAAISASATVRFYNYVKSGETSNILSGSGNGSDDDTNRISGSGNGSIGKSAVVIGDRCAVGDDFGVAIGEDSVAGNKAVAIGANCVATGLHSFALGANSKATGNKTLAFDGGQATAQHSIAFGTTNTAYEDQIAVGYYNGNKSTTVFEVGAGTSGNRKNAFEVYRTGYISMNNGTDKYLFAKSGGKDGYYDTSGTFHSFEPLYLEQSVTLSTTQDVTATFSNAAITANSRIEPWTSDYTIVPSNVVATAGSCTVTFKKASSAQTITVGIEVK